MKQLIERLSLRLRILLFFILMALCALLSVGAGLWLGYSRSAASVDAFVIAGIVAGFGTLLSVAGIWLLFDEHVAKPVTRIASELRSRVHGGVSGEIDSTVARYLGDLAPAAVAVSGRLGADNLAAAERIAAETARLSTERQRLATALSQVPVAVILTTDDFRVSLYDNQASAALETQGPLCIGHSLFDFLDQEDLLAAVHRIPKDTDGIDADTGPRNELINLRTADRLQSFSASLSRLDGNAGFLLTLDSPVPVPARHSLVFHFSQTTASSVVTREDVGLDDLTYVVFDLETTGLDPQQDEVVQLGAVRLLSGTRIEGEELDLLVNPGCPIPPASTRIHGITDAMVATAPRFPAVADRFRRFSKDAVLVAHHAPFDLAFMHREARAAGIELNNAVLDTAKLSVLLFGAEAQHTLDALAERFEVHIPPEHRHTALGDARVTAEILERMIPILTARGFGSFRTLAAAMP